jgi:hypothetical protein
MGRTSSTYRENKTCINILVEKLQGKRSLLRLENTWELILKLDINWTELDKMQCWNGNIRT